MKLDLDPARRVIAAWHTLKADECASRLQVEVANGLDPGEVQERLEHHGENRLAEKPPRSKWLAFLDQFKSLLILVLVGAAGLAGAIGDIKVSLAGSILSFVQASLIV